MAKRKPATESVATIDRPAKGTSGEPTLTRSQQLQGAVMLFLAEWKAYCSDENCDNPPDKFWDACADLVNLYDGDIPAEHRAMEKAVENLGREAYNFENRSNQNDYYPHKAFWKCVEEVDRLSRGVVQPERKPPLESMVDLASGKANDGKPVPNAQIALMWDCPIEDVVRELANPGSVCTPEYCEAAEARRFKQSKGERFGTERPIVDMSEVANMLAFGTEPREVCEATGASPEQVASAMKRKR